MFLKDKWAREVVGFRAREPSTKLGEHPLPVIELDCFSSISIRDPDCAFCILLSKKRSGALTFFWRGEGTCKKSRRNHFIDALVFYPIIVEGFLLIKFVFDIFIQV